MIAKAKYRLKQQVSLAPLATFRVVFGLIMLAALIRFAANGWIEELYINPEYLFPFYGFEWLPRPGAFGVYGLFAVASTSLILVILGWYYRIGIFTFFLSFTWIELLDKANYLNHYYFISLVAFVLIFLPAHHVYSRDARRSKSGLASLGPLWTVGSLRLLLGLVYVYAGIAKLNADWLIHAMPLKMWLPQHADMPVIGSLFEQAWTPYFFSWGGALYDLTIPFLLLYRRTRLAGYMSVIFFHIITFALFPIGMFPFIMMGCSLVFLPSEMHRKAWGMIAGQSRRPSTNKWKVAHSTQFVLAAFFAIQLLFPWRYVLYPDNVFWTEEGYRFGWRVMLMEKGGYAQFYVKDPEQPGELEICNRQFLTPNQEKMMATQPDMLLNYARIIERHYESLGVADPEVRAEVWVTLNGSGSRLFIDPWTDLTRQQDSFAHKDWILPSDSVVTFNDFQMLKGVTLAAK